MATRVRRRLPHERSITPTGRTAESWASELVEGLAFLGSSGRQRQRCSVAKADDGYLERRAEAELQWAERAEHPRAVKAHYHLSGFYLDRIYNVGAASD
jgi:hypothetical protein